MQINAKSPSTKFSAKPLSKLLCYTDWWVSSKRNTNGLQSALHTWPVTVTFRFDPSGRLLAAPPFSYYCMCVGCKRDRGWRTGCNKAKHRRYDIGSRECDRSTTRLSYEPKTPPMKKKHRGAHIICTHPLHEVINLLTIKICSELWTNDEICWKCPSKKAGRLMQLGNVTANNAWRKVVLTGGRTYLFSANDLLWIGDDLLYDVLWLVRDENERTSLVLDAIKWLLNLHYLQFATNENTIRYAVSNGSYKQQHS